MYLYIYIQSIYNKGIRDYIIRVIIGAHKP